MHQILKKKAASEKIEVSRLMSYALLKDDLDRYHRSQGEGGTDTAFLALPQPKRADFLMMRTLQNSIREIWPRADEVLMDPTACVERLVNIGLAESPRFPEFLAHMLGSPSGTNLGEAVLIFLSMRHRIVGGRLFQISDALERNLELTDLGEDLPCDFLRLPYRSIYLESGSTRSSKFRIFHKMSGEHIYEGVYCQESSFIAETEVTISPNMVRLFKIPAGARVRKLDLCFVGSPVGHKGMGDDATYSISLTIPDEQMDIKTALELCQQAHDESALSQGFMLATGKERVMTVELLSHLVKQLLYINMKDARLQDRPEATEAEKKIMGLGPSKRPKAIRRAEKLYDHIVVGADMAFPGGADFSQGEGDGKHVATHWRRGYYRNQRFGEGLTQKRLAWIYPVLVNADKLGDTPSSKKDYIVKI